MTIAAPSPVRGRHSQRSDYAVLLSLIQAQGLMRRRHLYYAVKISLLLAALAAVGVGFFLLGDSWFQLLLAAAVGILLTQFGFLGHDAAHRQIFASGPANEMFASVVGGLLVGMSSTWWTKKHTRHHAAPNQIGKDPDIAPTILRFYPPERRQHSKVLAFVTAHQLDF